MISVDEARARMLGRLVRMPSETIALDALDGRTLAQAIFASRDQPPFDAAVMDGYAFRAVDAPGPLRIVGEAAAGHAFARALDRGEAVRISTGAPLPTGADVVLAQEDARVAGTVLTAPATESGVFVRPRGGDFRVGDALLDAGRTIDPGATAIIAGAGLRQALATRKPLVAILSNGDELVSPGEHPHAHQIFDSATYAVAHLARAWGAAVQRCTPVRDASADLSGAIAAALPQCDMLVVIGGASVGPHDHLRPVLRALGAEIIVEGVNVRPGRPTWFAAMPDGTCVLGLPGNPASALVCARLFLAPAIETMLSGAAARSLTTFVAQLSSPLPANGGREAYVRAIYGAGEVSPIAEEDSSLMTVLARSNCLIRRAALAPQAAPPEMAECMNWTP